MFRIKFKGYFKAHFNILKCKVRKTTPYGYTTP